MKNTFGGGGSGVQDFNQDNFNPFANPLLVLPSGLRNHGNLFANKPKKRFKAAAPIPLFGAPQ